MKNRFFWFTYVVSCLSVLAVCLILYFQGSDQILWIDLLQVVAPVLIISLILTIIFSQVMWSPIDKFMESFPEYTDIEKRSLVKILQRVQTRYDINLSDNQSKLKVLLGLINQLQEGVVIVDQDEKVYFHNSAAASILHFSLQPSEKWLWEIIRSTELMDHIRKTIHEKQEFQGESKLIIPQETSVLYKIIPLPSQANESGWKVLLLVQDITNIRKLEKVRSDFIGNVSHELKSPLTAILGYSEMLSSEEKIEPEKQKHYSKIIHNNVVRLIDIVNDLLVLSKIETGESLQKTTFSIQELFKDIEELYRKKLNKKSIQFSFELDKPDLTLHADKLRVRQLLINLIDNAVKFTQDFGMITLNAKKVSHEIVISVSDTGIGIPFIEQERIFERFYQVDKARTGESEGTGLGLSIVKHIVEEHNGSVTVESEFGKGSKFTVVLPEETK
ncbi:GHKL domain-containing protein [bacterium]|nr:GHKL domain-containing protein [bacterium]